MKILLSLFAAAAGAGFVFHDQLQAWLRPTHGSVAEVYYLRAAQHSTNPDGTVVNWPAGQPLRTTFQAAAAEGAVALTDGRNVLQVPRNALTRDANEAAALRQDELVSQNAAAASIAEIGIPSTYRSGPVTTANAAPAYYYPTYVVTVQATPAPQVHHRVHAVEVSRPLTNSHPPRPIPTPGH